MLVESFPEKLRSQVHVSQIDFRNRPPNVTRVPTLMTQQGDTLVGADVFAYLKRWRQDAIPPGTAEAFAAISNNKIAFFLLVVAAVAVGLYFYRRRITAGPTITSPGGTRSSFHAGTMPVGSAANLFW